MKKKRLTPQEKIKETRKSWGMTQRAFGAEIGRSERSIQDYEAGMSVPPAVEKLIDYMVKEREAESV